MILNTLNVIGLSLSIIGFFAVILLGVRKLTYNKNSYKRIFISFLIFLTGLVTVWIISLNKNYIHENKTFSSSTDLKNVDMGLKSGAQIDLKYDKKVISVAGEKNNPSFIIKAGALTKPTKIKIKQQYLNSFLVKTIEYDNINIKDK